MDNKMCTSNRKSIMIAGLLVVLTSLTVMYGWITHNYTITRLVPNFPLMQFNTALCFFALGVSNFIPYKGPVSYIRCFSALFVIVVSLLTLFEYVFNFNIGIDQLFANQTISGDLSLYPGRMSPNTAGCFLLFGIAKIMVRVDKYIPILKGSQISLYLVVFLLSILSIVGYITKKHFLFSWGSVTGMALHTSACFLILSIVKIRFKAFRLKIQILGIVLSSLIFTAFLVAWLYSIDQQDRRINAKINKDLAIIYSNLDKKTQPRV